MGWRNGKVERFMKSIVLLHAFPLDHRMWDGIVDEIAISGWQVFTPDFRGCGRAVDWQAIEPPTLKQLAQDVLDLMDKYGVEKFVVGGCSLGGYVAMEIMRIAPERIAAAIFIDTKASADSPEQKANRLRVADSVQSANTTEAFWRAMLPNVLGKTTNEQNPYAVEFTKSIMSDSRVNGVANLQIAMSDRPDSHDAISNFIGPILSIRGDEDSVVSAEDHQKIVKEAKDALHVTLENCGHLAPIEKPEETATAIVDFLNTATKISC